MTQTLSNAEIADRLERHGQLLEVAGENAFRARAFTRAAESIRGYPDHVARIASSGDLRAIPGVGEGIAAAIGELVATRSFAAHDELTQSFPESLLEITALASVGAKTARRLHTSLGVTDLATLEAALVAGRIGEEKGLGRRVEENVRKGIEALRLRTGRIPLGVALPLGRALLDAYQVRRPGDRISIAGSARRWEDTVGDLDFVIATLDPDGAAADVAEIPLVSSAHRISAQAIRLTLSSDLQADVYFCPPDEWGSTLVRATGSGAHLARLGEIPAAAAEEAIYAANALSWIPPELRSGRTEFTRWREIPALVTLDRIRGEFHAHTTWSDGAASVLDMAGAAIDRGYTFLGITDHSHGLGIAGGLSVERLAAQREEIAAAQAELGDRLLLLAGSEVEVRRDGSLDFSEETLANLDVVVASLHVGLRQPRDELTGRLEAVLRDPHVDIIAHPSGRLIERRPPGDFAWDHVFAIAAETGTALEINADPARLDLTAEHAMRASAAGAMITINCDAHHPEGFSVMEYGIAVARKAWLTPERILNCWARDEVVGWLASRSYAEPS